MPRTDVTFPSGGGSCAAWLYVPGSAPASGPILVMAHGLGGVRQMRLDAFAERFSSAVYRCLVYDYRPPGPHPAARAEGPEGRGAHAAQRALRHLRRQRLRAQCGSAAGFTRAIRPNRLRRRGLGATPRQPGPAESARSRRGPYLQPAQSHIGSADSSKKSAPPQNIFRA